MLRRAAALLLLSCPLLQTCPYAHAAPDDEGFDAFTLFSLGAQVDQEGGTATTLSVGHDFTPSTWAVANGGFTTSAGNDSGNGTRYGSFDLEQMFGIAGFGAGVELWGDGDDLRTQGWRGALLLRPGHFRLRASAERRRVDATFDALILGVPVHRKGNLEINGFGGSASFFGDSGFNAFVGHTEWEYSQDPQGLAFLARFATFTDTALTLSNSFLQRSTLLSLGYSHGANSFAADFARDIGAVQRDTIFTYSASWTRSVAAAHDLEFRVGVSDGQTLDASAYFGLTWYYYR